MTINRINEKFKHLKENNQKGLITFITAGDPNLDKTIELVLAMETAGADIVELGVPFSDPSADGPVIQQSSLRALQAGTNLVKILDIVKLIREKSQIPLVLMTYYNPVLHLGLAEFCHQASIAGVDGLIIPDLPYEESFAILKFTNEHNLNLIPLVAPTTPPDRIKLITGEAKGFIYCVSLTGVTGVRDSLGVDISDFMENVRAATDVPVAVGFGISNPEQAAAIAKVSDAVIVGSALVKIVGEFGDSSETVDNITTQVKALKASIY